MEVEHVEGPIIASSDGESCLNGSESGDMCKSFVMIHAIDLSESFANKSGLVALNLPGRNLLDVKYPFACNNIPPPWPLNNSPSSCLFQHAQFRLNCQVPLQLVHSPPHLLEQGRIQCLSFSNYCSHCEFLFLCCSKTLRKERLVLLSI